MQRAPAASSLERKDSVAHVWLSVEWEDSDAHVWLSVEREDSDAHVWLSVEREDSDAHVESGDQTQVLTLAKLVELSPQPQEISLPTLVVYVSDDSMFTGPHASPEKAHGKAALWTSGVFYKHVAPSDKWPAPPIGPLSQLPVTSSIASNMLRKCSYSLFFWGLWFDIRYDKVGLSTSSVVQFKLAYMLHYTMYVELSLCVWDKAYLIMVHHLFDVFLDLV
ncbi:hypothetical protein STEG23_009236, partial [Scotinomys teguina]